MSADLHSTLDRLLEHLRAGAFEDAASLVQQLPALCAGTSLESHQVQALRPLLQECQATAVRLQARVGEELRNAGTGRRAVGGYRRDPR